MTAQPSSSGHWDQPDPRRLASARALGPAMLRPAARAPRTQGKSLEEIEVERYGAPVTNATS